MLNTSKDTGIDGPTRVARNPHFHNSPSDIKQGLDIVRLNPDIDPVVVNLKEQGAKIDEARIQELQRLIRQGEGDLGKLARIGSPISITPDSIDEVGPRFEYTHEDAKAYLDELNEKYPIRQVLGDHYDRIASGAMDLFNMSPIGKAEFETRLSACIVESARAGKWISSDFNYGYIPLQDLTKQADMDDNNPFGLIKKYELIGLYEDFMKQGILDKILKRDKVSQMHAFPKEHLIQDLMRRLENKRPV